MFLYRKDEKNIFRSLLGQNRKAIHAPVFQILLTVKAFLALS